MVDPSTYQLTLVNEFIPSYSSHQIEENLIDFFTHVQYKPIHYKLRRAMNKNEIYCLLTWWSCVDFESFCLDLEVLNESERSENEENVFKENGVSAFVEGKDGRYVVVEGKEVFVFGECGFL